MNKKMIGTLCGIGAAVCYGTNPLGALKLYAQNMNTGSVLVWRFSIAWVIVAIIMLLRKESLRINKKEFLTLTGLGLLFVFSSMTLYQSFRLMDAGVASTILFVYPVMTAVIMRLCFGEHHGWRTVLAICLSFLGVMLLYWNGSGATLSTKGVVFVLISALTYALYIILMNRSQLEMSSFKVNFFVLIYCTLGNIVFLLLTGDILMVPSTPTGWFWALWLAVVPAILALVMMVYAARYIGSTPTAIIGALEPLTAVIIGIFVFGESFSWSLAIGIILILASVVTVAIQNKKMLSSKQ